MTVENIEKDMVIKSLWFDLASTVDYGPSLGVIVENLDLDELLEAGGPTFYEDNVPSSQFIINYRLMPNGFGAATLWNHIKCPGDADVSHKFFVKYPEGYRTQICWQTKTLVRGHINQLFRLDGYDRVVPIRIISDGRYIDGVIALWKLNLLLLDFNPRLKPLLVTDKSEIDKTLMVVMSLRKDKVSFPEPFKQYEERFTFVEAL